MDSWHLKFIKIVCSLAMALLISSLWGVFGIEPVAETLAIRLNRPALAVAGDIVINEIAWSGTTTSATDEWIELHNPTTQTVSLDGWVLTGTTGLSLTLTGSITAGGYYLIESDEAVISDVVADLVVDFDIAEAGDSLFLITNSLVIDSANQDGSPWPAGTAGPDYRSMERLDPLAPDSDANWASNDTLTRNGLDAAGNPLNGTPRQTNSTTLPPPSRPLLIGEFLYDGQTPSTEGDEFIELCNPDPTPLDLSGYKVGDAAVQGGGEGMYQLPAKVIAADACVVIAKNAVQFQARFGELPDFEVIVSGSSYTDQPTVPNLEKYKSWAGGSWALSNNGDELIVLGPDDSLVDSVVYRNGDYDLLGIEPPASAPEPRSLQRVWPVDTNSMPNDFVQAEPTPGMPTKPPSPPTTPPPPAELPGGMRAYWGDLHAHTTYSDGAGPPHYALAQARAAGLHFYGITDHGWWLNSVEWAKTLTQTQQATVPGEFIALRGVEWSHQMAGHINVFNTDTLISRENPLFADLGEFYTWLADNPEVIAQFNHPDPKYGGTFHDFEYHPAAAQVMYLQEIGNNAQEYTTYEPSFVQSNISGWQTAPTNNSDSHTARWGFDTPARTGIVAPALTEADLLAALRARRVFATEDSNLAISLRAGDVWMGSRLTDTIAVNLTIDVVDPDPEPLTLYLYDTNLLLASRPFSTSTVQWQLSIEPRPGHFFWGKATQADGDRAYSAPLWVAGTLAAEQIFINEILPAPGDQDWDGNGVADADDEWLELFNPTARPVGLGGWRLTDTSNIVYNIPLSVTIPAGGFATLYKAQTGFALNNGGDTVTLSHPNGQVVDTFSYPQTPGYDETWCRLPDGDPTWSDNCGPSPNAPNWEQIVNGGPLSVSIFEAKRLTDDAWVKVTGRVTVPPGVLGARTMYIQDETAGIMLYLPKNHQLAFELGDKVEAVGNLNSFYHEFEIKVDERSDIRRLKVDSPVPPLPIATTSLLEPYEGMLVQLQGQAVRFQGSVRLWVDDGSDPAEVYIRRSTGIRKPFMPLGTPLTVVGIVSQHSDANPTRYDYHLLPRYTGDLIIPALPTPTPPAADWPTLLPETGH